MAVKTPGRLHVVLLALALATATAGANTPQLTPHQQDLSSVRKEIRSLKRDIAQKEADRKEAQDALRESERALKATHQALGELARKRKDSGARLAELTRELEATRDSTLDLKTRIADILRRQYRGGHHDALRLALNEGDPNRNARDLAYYRHIARAQQALVARLLEQEQALAQLADEIGRELARLGLQSHLAESQQDKLQQAREEKQQETQALTSEIRSKQGTLTKLQQDERRLSSLIAQINRQIEAQRREAARKRAEERKARELARQQENARRRELAAEAKRQGKTLPAEQTRQIAAEPVDSVADASLSGKAFRSLQGRMKLPVAGSLAGRYGSARQEGSSWKGLFIRTTPGQAVRAVADGNIVYADALRGFGNAVIIDHGGNYMTVYTGLSSIGRSSGQRVSAGDPVGLTGSLDSGETGLYFELRHMGRPINPQSWMR
ncbi:murein hydrolase activator EnvC family protein [Crenobacter caeni]|uniref:Peptidoglycan DD-metalloendopeptidase family protein n=1 Tax=Crenobacter caeni TaxID=2705474 RepID=A0A6B2KUA7_9NEIS|nr:peptidoglycan DD-metalloendopeptidase family protein [Crenobacter caeni]NDV13825.1 peptidoglycan DD-metalloendopeptidase family protein [Crenobacter caeni]